jgi:hypothetical protein
MRRGPFGLLLVLCLLPYSAPSEVVLKGPVVHELGTMTAAAPIPLATETVTVRVPLISNASVYVNSAMPRQSKTKLVLTLSGIDFDKIPEVHYQVYLNLPPAQRPDYKGIYFVGNLVLFSFHPHGGSAEHPPVVNFDVTNTVRELVARNLWNGRESSVSFVARWLVDAQNRPFPIPPGVRLRFTTAKLIAIAPAG